MIKDTLKANETSSPNGLSIAVLKEHFPACFKKDGSFDIERFRAYLSDKVRITNEGYELKFLGKNYARLLVSLDTTTVIQPDEEHNSKPGNADSKNVYISGDNLDALKHLLKSYARRVKCIYIDPPYNTGADGFVYNDSFNFTAEELSEKLSISEEQALRILDLTKRGSASHSAWLMFMYPRLLLARDLLTEDGVIFISIDDNEQGNLRLLCDDVFGEENFVANINWKGRGGRQDSTYYAAIHEYILCYAKRADNFIAGKEMKSGDRYPNFDAEKQRYYKTQLARKWGSASLRTDRPNLFYPITAPDGTKHYPMKSSKVEGRWRWQEARMKQEIACGNIEFVKSDNEWVAYEKIYAPLEGEEATKKYTTWIDDVGNGSGTVKDLFGVAVFDYPKSPELIIRFLKMANVEEDDIILDFFSGSATTAHAVMQLNAEDSGNRQFIMVQLQERVKAKSIAEKAGYLTIDQIGIERIIRSAKAIKEAHPDTSTDLGFKRFTLIEPSEKTLDKVEIFDPEMLFDDPEILKQLGKPTVLATWLNYDGYGLNAAVETLDLYGYMAYFYKNHLYLIDPEFNEYALAALMSKYESDGAFCPDNVVLFGYSFVWRETEMLSVNLKRLKDTEKNLRVNLAIRY